MRMVGGFTCIMIDIDQFRAEIGLFHANNPIKTCSKGKWFFFKSSFFRFLFEIIFLLLFLFKLCKNLFKTLMKKIERTHKSILFITISFYYWRSAIYLFICVDVSVNPGPTPSETNFRIMHWNANSLPAHNFNRISLIEAYNAIHNFHLISITETALTNSITDDKIEIQGYTPIRNNLPKNDTHGGVMIYHRADLAAKNRTDLQNHSNTLVMELSIARKKIFFVLVYRKYGQSPDEFKIFIEKFDELMQKIKLEHPYCNIVCGDFNAHFKGWWDGDTNDNFGTSTQKVFDEYGFSQLVNQPTFITNNSRTCIDLVATDQPNLVLANEVHPSLHTNCHHQVNFVKLNLKCPPPPPYERRVWHYGRSNTVAIQTSLLEYDWDSSLSILESSPEDQVEHFDNVLMNIAKKFIPFDDKLIKPKDHPWVTKNSKNLYNRYRRKFKQFIRNGCNEGDKFCIDEMKNQYTILVEREKENYLSSLGITLANPQTGPKKYWSTMKKLLKKNVTSVIPPILHNGIFITDIREKCNIFNKYFKDQCKTIETSSSIPSQINKTTNFSLNHVIFTESNILEHIRGLNIEKAHGHDGISVRIIKMCDFSISKPLFIIFKNCLAKGYFPKKWKKANVIPIYKKNERNLINNYRPISLLPVCSKIFEKVIFDNLYSYIFQNNFISDMQSGYKKGDSCIKQLLSITHEIHKAFDSNPPKEIRAVFLDISRAFDRVWHDGLIFKLQKIGVGGEMIRLLSSFLSEREQRVTTDGQFSEWVKIEAGVPQGSILGPILFLVYINDLFETVESDIRIFADDTFIFRIVDQHSTEKLNSDLANITVWAHDWKMLFNPDMTKQAVEVTFSNKRKPSLSETLNFNGIPVKIASETKHLGMILDTKLSFGKHFEDKFAKANQGLGMMKLLKKWIPRHSLEEIYKLYVRPHLDYGDILYDISETEKHSIFPLEVSNSLSKRVETVQYEAARIVSGAWQGTSRNKLYADLGWETLYNRRTLRKLCLLYEIQKNNFPRYLKHTLDQYQYNENSRFYNRLLLKSIPCRTNKYKLSFFPSTIRDWNKLENDIKQSISKNVFKKKILNKIRPKNNSYFGIKDNDKTRLITQLRMGLSSLRAHKFRHNFLDTSDPLCFVCGSAEDTEHYLLHCMSYRLSRTTLMQNVTAILNFDVLNLPHKKIVEILLYGEKSVDDDKNRKILDEVIKYISVSKRLDT